MILLSSFSLFLFFVTFSSSLVSQYPPTLNPSFHLFGIRSRLDEEEIEEEEEEKEERPWL